MKLTKKLLAILLCVCMVMAIVPMAHAEDIKDMAITVEAPAVGGKPATTVQINAPVPVVVEKVTWEGELDANGCFQTLQAYRVRVTVMLQGGGTFNEKVKFNNNFTVNGQKIENMRRDTSTLAEILYKFPALNATTATADELHTAYIAVYKGFQDFTANQNTTKESIVEAAKALLPKGSRVVPKIQDNEFIFEAPTEKKDGKLTTLVRLWCDLENESYALVCPVKYVKETPAPAAPAFTDVKADAYYANPVAWAVEKKITTGTYATTFSPDTTCTRAQILTFLWRAVGSPKSAAKNTFTDIKSADYFYDAAIWAIEKGMVSGTTFAPNTPCTRADTVTYLWKNAGAPATAASNTFTDVAASSDYAQAVAWAVSKNVTSGTSATTFSPASTCTRGQIVTFLFRALNK